jgi:hypothetical protein
MFNIQLDGFKMSRTKWVIFNRVNPPPPGGRRSYSFLGNSKPPSPMTKTILFGILFIGF